ncbi:MAG: hypothetical protein L3J63_10955 [Geopsychrobacter sp.]|nr:hypothetical protein [Geopsychrobacter sp.]
MSAEQTDGRKMCELHAAGLMEQADHRCDDPKFVCGKCRRKANKAEYLHNPLALKKSAGDNFWS